MGRRGNLQSRGDDPMAKRNTNEKQEPVSGEAAEAANAEMRARGTETEAKKPGTDRMAAARAALARKSAEAKKKRPR